MPHSYSSLGTTAGVQGLLEGCQEVLDKHFSRAVQHTGPREGEASPLPEACDHRGWSMVQAFLQEAESWEEVWPGQRRPSYRSRHWEAYRGCLLCSSHFPRLSHPTAFLGLFVCLFFCFVLRDYLTYYLFKFGFSLSSFFPSFPLPLLLPLLSPPPTHPPHLLFL